MRLDGGTLDPALAHRPGLAGGIFGWCLAGCRGFQFPSSRRSEVRQTPDDKGGLFPPQADEVQSRWKAAGGVVSFATAAFALRSANRCETTCPRWRSLATDMLRFQFRGDEPGCRLRGWDIAGLGSHGKVISPLTRTTTAYINPANYQFLSMW